MVQLLGWVLQRDRISYKSIDFLCGITSRDLAFIDSVVEAVYYSRQADIALSSDYMALSSEYRHSIYCVIKGVYQT